MSNVDFLPDGVPGAPPGPNPPPPGPPTARVVPPTAQGLYPPYGPHLAPPAPPRRRWRLTPRTLTGQIVAGVVALVVLLVFAFCTVTYISQRSFLVSRLDQQLNSVATANQQHLDHCLAAGQDVCPIGFGRNIDFKTAAAEWVVQLTSDGTQIPDGVASGGGLYQMQLTPSQARAIAADPSANRSITTADGYDLRVTGRDVTTPGGTIIVVSGLSSEDSSHALGRLLSAEVLIGLIALLVASLATAYGVRFTLGRLRRVTATAQNVAAELSPEGAGLDRRVENDQPDSEVGQLATSFNTMLSAVETQFAARVESEQRMRQFLADASHELRTPLTSIRGFAELARMQRAMGDTSDDNLHRIESEGTRMSRLVEDLLMLARGDADENRSVQSELIEIDALVDDVVNSSRAAFPERRIDMQVTGTSHVLGDRDQLVRVLRNLVTNAAVHTDPEGSILVRAAGGSNGVTIEVVDGGPGLSPEDAAHVFERFWRADKARTRARGGSGLGLSIVASIVRAHGGAVRFDSSVEGGSTITVWLPAAHEALD